MRLAFDSGSHTYRLGAEVLPSVTQVLKATGVINYSHIPQDVLAKASHRGRWVHLACQAMDDGRPVPPGMPDEYQRWVDAYVRFKETTGFQVALNEHRSYHRRLKYAGTMDRTGWIPLFGTGNWLIDFKTGVYLPGHRLQLAAYAGLLAEPRRYKRAVLELRGDASYKLTPFPRAEWDADFREFKARLSEFRKEAA